MTRMRKTANPAGKARGKGPARRRFLRIPALVLLLGLGAPTQEARALNPDNMTIRLTIEVNIDVAIDTGTTRWRNEELGSDIPLSAGSLDLGPLSLGNTVYMLRPATVTVTTDFADTELDVQGVALDLGAWSFDQDGVAQENQLQVYALFGPTSNGTSPAIADYDDCASPCDNSDDTGDQITTSIRRYGDFGGDAAGDNGVYQNTTYATASENFAAGATSRHMWIRVDTPPTTTETGVKSFQIILTGQPND